MTATATTDFLMRTKLQYPGLFLLLATLLAPPLAGQTYSCVPDTSVHAVNLRNYAIDLAGSDASLDSTRQSYQLPLVSPTQVKTISHLNTCKTAAQAYHLAVRGPSVPAISRSVVVVKVGNSRYLVRDPSERAGEFQVTVIFDSNFQRLEAFLS